MNKTKKQIILDIGGGDNTRNDKKYVKAMIDSVIALDSGIYDIVFKFQLFKDIPGLTPLKQDVFEWVYSYCRRQRGCKKLHERLSGERLQDPRSDRW